jgi:hypothetical protein
MDLCPIIYMAPGIGGLMARLGLLVVSWLLIIVIQGRMGVEGRDLRAWKRSGNCLLIRFVACTYRIP